jgi:hypothetical protein
MKWLQWLLFITFSFQAGAYESHSKDFEMVQGWSDFDLSLQKVEELKHTEAISYILSGLLVTIGGMAGATAARVPSTKFIYGLSQSLGVAGIGYGSYMLYNGHEYSSFARAVRNTPMTSEQRDQLVREFLKAEQEQQETLRQVRLYTYLALGTLNLAAATQESERSAKTMFQIFSGINYALALSCTF